MSRAHIRGLLVVLVLVAATLLSGCGGDNASIVFQNVSERAAWSTLGYISFASFGGNGRLYVNRIKENGGNLFVLTPSDNDQDFADEGGRHPAYTPNGTQLAIASRRGASEAIFIIAAGSGDRDGATRVTDDTGLGADNQPNFSPDGTKITFTSTRREGNQDILIINADGTGSEPAVATAAAETWAAFSPDGTRIAYTSDANGDTDVWVKDLGTDPADPGTCLTADSPFRDEAPAWAPDGNTICFHSNRAGDFDIWAIDAADGANPRAFTADQRSDGFPVYNATGERILLTRDREVWTVPARPYAEWAGDAQTEARQLTRRL